MLNDKHPDPKRSKEASGEDEAVADTGLRMLDVVVVKKGKVLIYLDRDLARVEEDAKEDACKGTGDGRQERSQSSSSDSKVQGQVCRRIALYIISNIDVLVIQGHNLTQ